MAEKHGVCRDGRCWARTSDLRLVEAEPDHFDSPYQTVPTHESPANYEVWTRGGWDPNDPWMTDRTFWSALRVLRRPGR